MSQTKNESKESYTQYLEEIIIDLLDSNSKWHDIQHATGLSAERCKKIENVYWDICSKLNV